MLYGILDGKMIREISEDIENEISSLNEIVENLKNDYEKIFSDDDEVDIKNSYKGFKDEIEELNVINNKLNGYQLSLKDINSGYVKQTNQILYDIELYQSKMNMGDEENE